MLFIHFRIIQETGGIHGIRDMGSLQSAIARPQASFNGNDAYTAIFLKTAVLFESLIKNHPFADGNKRTAIASADMFLRQNGFRTETSQEELVSFAMKIAAEKVNIEYIQNWFKQNSISIIRK